jgi:hypothetical protein
MSVDFVRRYIDPRQQYRRWLDPRVRTLRSADLLTYLRHRGWKELPPERDGLLAFQEPGGAMAEGRPFCQFVPLHEHYNDYVQVVFELLTGLAEYENRQATEVIDDVLQLAQVESANGVVQSSEATAP